MNPTVNWPLYKSELLVIGNSLSQVGILTLFTKKEMIANYLNKDDYALVGQLYNPSQGISILLRNCLVNKNLRYLIICGQDFSGSGEALLKLSQAGVEELWDGNQLQGYLIKNLTEKRIIEKEIPLEAIELFRKNVKVLDYRHLKDFSQLSTIINNLLPLSSYGDPELFPEAQLDTTTFSADPSLFQARGRTVGEVWLKILDTVMRFGIIKKSDYAEDQKEVLNLAAVVTSENPESIQWEDYFQFTKEHLQEYLPRVLTNQNVEGVNYTYGNRLRSWRGIDQMDSLIRRLKESLHTRRAVAVTWDVEKDHLDAEAPCLDLIQCLVQNNVLYLTAFFRSNDMFAAWPENALALRKLQGLIAKELGIGLGSLTTISGSAHIYQGSWIKAAGILGQNKIRIEQLNDPRGNFVIYLQNNLINIEHQSPEGIILEKITGRTAQELSCQLAQKQKISDYYHALYLGRELQKAELALQNNLNYEQERDLMQKKVIQKGKFIVIDGLDGSGKTVQTNRLVQRLRSEGHLVEMADFPQYGSWSAQFVERYLRGEFGSASDVSAKKASLFYALDRYAASFQIRRWLEEGKIVIANRYVSANKGHQLGKIQDQQQMKQTLDWINELEYDILDIPVPHLTLFLHMKPEIGQWLVDRKKERAYTQGKKRDIHEADLSHLQHAERAYLFCLEADGTEKWQRIVCFSGENLRSVDDIHEEIYRKVQQIV